MNLTSCVVLHSLFSDVPKSNYYIPLFVILLILLATTMLSFFYLIYKTNEDSISGMIAQRFHESSYMVVISITGLSIITSSTVVMSASLRSLICKENIDWMIYCAVISPIMSSLILVFPIVVHKSAHQLQFTPLESPKRIGFFEHRNKIHVLIASTNDLSDYVLGADLGAEDEKKHLLGNEMSVIKKTEDNSYTFRPVKDKFYFEEKSISFKVKGIENMNNHFIEWHGLRFKAVNDDESDLVIEADPRGNIICQVMYDVHLWVSSPKWSAFLHYFVVLSGTVLGFINVFGYVNFKVVKNDPIGDSKTATAAAVMGSVSCVCLIIFMAMKICNAHPRMRTWVEGVGLIILYTSILMISISSADMI